MSYRKQNIRKSCKAIDGLIDVIYLKTMKTLFEGEDRGNNLITIKLAMYEIRKNTNRIKRTTWRGDKN